MAARPGPRDPEQLEATATTATAEIAPETHMGAVHLTVADLGRSIRYYRSRSASRWSRRTTAWPRSAPAAAACWC